MAGFRVVWANEFVPAAQQSYKVNADPACFLDGRDIRQVQSEDVLQATGLARGELDLFDGSPPCQAFSTAGKRQKGWGKAKRYEHGASQCNETLFSEYIRLLQGLMPKTFVAENVSGLVKGVAKGYFLEILAALKASGYQVRCKVLDAQWLGVPQMRQRTIFVGVRNDLGIEPAFPKPLPYRYSVREALPWIGKAVHDTGGFVRDKEVTDGPCPSVTIGVNSLNSCHYKVEDNSALRLPPSRMAADAFNCQDVQLDKPCPTVTIASPGNDLRVPVTAVRDRRGGFGKEGPITDQPAPSVMAGTAGNLWVEQPLATVQAGAGARASSSFSHGTCLVPGSRRKFTIAELRRICGFPDDFVLTGSYAQQWERLGNSVPPVMMFHIACVIRDKVLKGAAG